MTKKKKKAPAAQQLIDSLLDENTQAPKKGQSPSNSRGGVIEMSGANDDDEHQIIIHDADESAQSKIGSGAGEGFAKKENTMLVEYDEQSVHLTIEGGESDDQSESTVPPAVPQATASIGSKPTLVQQPKESAQPKRKLTPELFETLKKAEAELAVDLVSESDPDPDPFAPKPSENDQLCLKIRWRPSISSRKRSTS